MTSPGGGTKLYKFFQSYPAIDYFPSLREVERLAQHKVNEIFGAFENVRYILERHEDTVRKRWCKKSTAKKKKLLLTAKPGMASEHRPDIAAELAATTISDLEDELFFVSVCTATNSEACLVPFLNLEDLLNPGSFLTLLNSRGRTPIETFSHTELHHCPSAWWPDSALLPYLQRFTMVFAGRNTRNTYGRIQRWRDSNDAWRSIYKGQAVHPGNGLQILCIQEIIYTFLQRCCHLLVGDLLAEGKGQQAQHPNIPPTVLVVDDTLNYTNRAEVSLMIPYGIPGQLDFGRLRSLISSKVGELEDHIWALREDPGYFSEVFHDYERHIVEYSVFIDGNGNAALKEQPDAVPGLILRNLITDPYYALFYWHRCLHLLDRLESTAARHSFKFPSHEELPEGYREDLLRLWTVLNAIQTDLHECFRQHVLATPTMRTYISKTAEDPDSRNYAFEFEMSQAKGDSVTIRFLEVLSRIIVPRDPPGHGFVAELDDLERLIIKNPAAKGLLSPFVWADFSQMSVSSECIQRIRFYQPWSTQLEYEMIFRKLELGLEFAIFTGRWRPVSTMRSFEDVALKRMADPSDGKFHYPITERRSCATTDALRLAEENLDDFWKTADSFCRKLTGSSFPDLLERDISHGRSLRRTAPWTEPSARKEDARFHESHSESFHQYTYKPFLFESYRGAEALTSVRRKVKTRGTVDLARAEGNDAPDSTDQTILPISVTVDKRSHLVFKTLFFSPSARDVPGEVSWKDFVHAMVQRGFEAEKLHGSSWRFTPTTLGAERAIQFHAPHGALSKLPLTWARRYGRRLEREYGWTGEMFTLT
ncbi:uncharacterized protein J4E88_001971 [Alternaria novae-zelandiae]|uniref:uncharacterized protein n=1 Tax=Alternaria novae-zelandiae TaxID=430562 RepID=UPI0020C4F775|nr:uncharacterized protein J4E88_001971 [Alternaria novae-zelandiae]KAI4693598.1 hypothetical protein J4E88_001971 [Alternaria novae-zelandiae]